MNVFSGCFLKKVEYDIFVFVVFLLLTPWLSALALGSRPSFKAYEIELAQTETRCFDFDGNGLEDIISIIGTDLRVFLQEPDAGFSKKADLVYSFKTTPAVLWPVKRNSGPGQNIFVMTKDGVSSLTYVDKTQPPAMEKIIDRQTIIAGSPDEDYPPVSFFTTDSLNNRILFISKLEPVKLIPHSLAFSVSSLTDARCSNVLVGIHP